MEEHKFESRDESIRKILLVVLDSQDSNGKNGIESFWV